MRRHGRPVFSARAAASAHQAGVKAPPHPVLKKVTSFRTTFPLTPHILSVQLQEQLNIALRISSIGEGCQRI